MNTYMAPYLNCAQAANLLYLLVIARDPFNHQLTFDNAFVLSLCVIQVLARLVPAAFAY